jgi:hypothetical protein
MAAAKKNVGGRPPRHPGERLSKSRTFRVRGGLDEYLQAAAAASGRSVSEEIEFQLELGRARKNALIEEWGPDVFAIADRAARALRHIEDFTGKPWHGDKETSDLFRRALLEIVSNVGIKIDSESIKDLKDLVGTHVGALSGGLSKEELATRFAAMGEPAPPRRKTSTDAEPPPGSAEQSGEDKK